MKYVLVRGGTKAAPIISSETNWLYGIRHDKKAYASVHMLDVNWEAYNWGDVCEKITRYQPVMALVPDFEDISQLGQVLTRIAQLQDLGVSEILVCPKFAEAVPLLPLSVVIAVSVPSIYAGYIPPLEQLRGRRVHLLGGNPFKQADLIRKINGVGGCVQSLDANGFVQKAGLGQFWQHGNWVQTRGKKWTDTELAIASAQNLKRYFDGILGESQRMLL